MKAWMLALALLSAAPWVAAEGLTGRVVGVADGDTITVLDAQRVQHKIRLAGIDAPEKRQPFGQVSKQHLADLVFGQEVELDCGRPDRYRREVCVVLLGGQDVNLAQVQAGLAWWYRQYAREQTAERREAYSAAEREAQEARRGLWQEPSPMPPWEWRHMGG